jgi:hypothetical protein
MRRRALAALALAAGSVVLLPGCATRRSVGPAPADTGPLGLELAKNGPWSEDVVGGVTFSPAVDVQAPLGRDAGAGVRAVDARPTAWDTARAANAGAPHASFAPREPAVLPAPEEPSGTRLPVPAARGTGEVAPKGAAPVKSVEAVARERFLDHPTEVRADAITLTVPARLLAEVRLTGAEVTEPQAGRRVADGGARLVCRELTLVGERITLRTRLGGTEDVQITARGDVSFVSRQADQVLREQGVRTLLITNDALTPLR